jgi:hypothetical protein
MVHAAHMLHQPKAIAHFEFSKHGRLSYIKQMKGWKKGDRLFVNYGIEGKDVWGTGYINLAAGMGALEDLDYDDSPGKSLTRSATRLSGESGAIASGPVKVVATLDEEKDQTEEEVQQAIVPTCEVTQINVQGQLVLTSIAAASLTTRIDEWRVYGLSDIGTFSSVNPTSVKNTLVHKGFIVLLSNFERKMQRLVHCDVNNFLLKDKKTITTSFDFKSQFASILDHFLSNSAIMLKFGWRSDDIERNVKFEPATTSRWCNGKNDMEIFAKYVYCVDPFVRQLHRHIFSDKSRRYSINVSDPILYMSSSNAAEDSEPRSFTSSNELVYVYHFPLTDDDDYSYGLWSGSVPLICAMDGLFRWLITCRIF